MAWTLSVDTAPILAADPAPSLAAPFQINLAQAQESIVAESIEQPAADAETSSYASRSVTDLRASIALPEGKFPENVAALRAETTPYVGDRRIDGRWAVTEQHWSATCLHHRPLYFEDVNLERHGYTASHVLQPAISATRFFASIAALPYKMALDRPHECIYTLGNYRPGSCAPRHWQVLPLHLGAAAVETAFVAGLIVLIP